MTQETYEHPQPFPLTSLTCQEITELILDYVTGEMPETTRTVFETHLRNCKDCVAFLHTYRQSMRATRTLHIEDVPAEMRTRVYQFLQSKLVENNRTP